MLNILLVAAGGALGSVLRYLAVLWITGSAGSGFPWGTFSVNVIGCLLIGIAGRLAGAELMSMNSQALLMTGMLGGFTTYSAFTLDSLRLFRSGQSLLAATYITGTTIAALCAVGFGFWLGGIFFRNLR